MDLHRLAAERSLIEFVRQGWHVLERTRFVEGWHLEAIASHLQAVTNGRITRLMVNVPPGAMKSLMVSVFWPAWEWGPRNRPGLRYLSTSYSENFAKRDARKMRDLIESEWYQSRWGDRVRLTRAGETSFANTAHGNREAMPFGSLTGGRGDRVIIDDPHSTEKAESAADIERATRIFRESVTTRLNNPKRSAIIVIMQRLSEKDVCGQIESLGLEYEKLILPMEFEPERRCRTSIGCTDPRTTEGELLFPQRFSRETVERDKHIMGSYAVAGQFQQRPAPRGGGMFRREWFEIVKAAPVGLKRWRAWDLAASVPKNGSDPDWTVGVRMSRTPEGIFYVEHVVRLRASALAVENTITATAETDGQGCSIHLPQDPGAAGKGQAEQLVRKLAGFTVKAETMSGSKETRATAFEAQCEAGNVKLVAGPWVEAWLDELTTFPAGGHDDQVDASADAFNALTLRQLSPVGKAKLTQHS